MLCYRDRTYCAAACRNTECDRNRTHVPADTLGLPVSWADLSEGCPGYVPAYQPEGGGEGAWMKHKPQPQ